MPGNSLRNFSRPTEQPHGDNLLSSLHLRRMRAVDLERVHRIELLSYAWPWTKGAFRDCLRHGYDAWLAWREDELVGYGVLFTGADESHLLNLCVHPQYRGMNLGRHLLHHLFKRAVQLKSTVLYLEVRPSNRTALHLYKREGFAEIGRRGNYYPARNGREDALVLARTLN